MFANKELVNIGFFDIASSWVSFHVSLNKAMLEVELGLVITD